MARVRGDRGNQPTGVAPASGGAHAHLRAAVPWAVLTARLVLGAVLCYAGVAKLAAPTESVRAVQAYQILPSGLTAAWANGQGAAEIALGALLIAGLATRLTAAASGLLLAMFVGAVASVWARGLSIDCGCFSGGGAVAASRTQYPLEILRDVGLAALAALIIGWAPGRLAADRLVGLGPAPGARPLARTRRRT